MIPNLLRREASARPGTVVAVGVAVIAVTYGLGRFTYGLLVPEMAPSLGMSDTAVGVSGAGSYAGYLAALLAAPCLVARIGPRRVTTLAAAATAVGMTIIAATPNAGMLAVGVTVAGTGSGLASPALAELVERLIQPRRRSPAQAWINAGTSLGILAGVGVALVTVGSWRVSWAALATIALVVAATPTLITAGPRQAATVVRVSGSARLILAAVTLGVASSVMWAFGREAVLRAGALSPTGSLAMWWMIGLGGLAGGLIGSMADRCGLRIAGRVGWVSMAAAVGLMALFPGSSVAVVVAAIGFGAAYMALTGVLLLWGVRIAADRPSSGVRTGFLALAASQLIATPLAGLVSETWGLSVAFALAAATAVAGAWITAPGGATGHSGSGSRQGKGSHDRAVETVEPVGD